MTPRFVDRLEAAAAERLSEPVLRYVRQGARDSVTASEAAGEWDTWRFLPQVLRDVTTVRTATTLLGTAVRTPLGVAPTTMQRAMHPDGEVAMARACAQSGALMVVSSNAGSTFEEIGATGVDWWLQMYVTAERAVCLPLLDRAVAAGARAVVLTVDTPVVGTKYDGEGPTVWDEVDPGWVRLNFPEGSSDSAGAEKATDLGPQDVVWLTQTTGLPVVVKGVLRAEDARRCVDAGAAAVWVSNHGGRQLDYATSTAACLEAVVREVGGTAEVYVDGGVRCGRHALAALALGARGVFLGRLPLYALAVAGGGGVGRLLAELGDELENALTLTGCGTVDRVPRDLLVAGPSGRPSAAALSAVTGATSARFDDPAETSVMFCLSPGSGGTQGRQAGRPAPRRNLFETPRTETVAARYGGPSGWFRSLECVAGRAAAGASSQGPGTEAPDGWSRDCPAVRV